MTIKYTVIKSEVAVTLPRKKETTKPLQNFNMYKIQTDPSSNKVFVLLLSYSNMTEYTHAITGFLKRLYCIFYLTMTREKNETKPYRVKLSLSKTRFFILHSSGSTT